MHRFARRTAAATAAALLHAGRCSLPEPPPPRSALPRLGRLRGAVRQRREVSLPLPQGAGSSPRPAASSSCLFPASRSVNGRCRCGPARGPQATVLALKPFESRSRQQSGSPDRGRARAVTNPNRWFRFGRKAAGITLAFPRHPPQLPWPAAASRRSPCADLRHERCFQKGLTAGSLRAGAGLEPRASRESRRSCLTATPPQQRGTALRAQLAPGERTGHSCGCALQHSPRPVPPATAFTGGRGTGLLCGGGGAGGNPARPGLRGAARLPALGAGRLRLRKGAGLSLGRAAGEGRDDGEGAGRGRLTLLALAPTASGRGAGFADVAAGDAPCVCGRWLPRPGAPPPRRPACGAVAAAAATICGVSRAGGGGPRRGG